MPSVWLALQQALQGNRTVSAPKTAHLLSQTSLAGKIPAFEIPVVCAGRVGAVLTHIREHLWDWAAPAEGGLR